MSDDNPFEWPDEFRDHMAKVEKQIADLHKRVGIMMECVTILMRERNSNAVQDAGESKKG